MIHEIAARLDALPTVVNTTVQGSIVVVQVQLLERLYTLELHLQHLSHGSLPKVYLTNVADYGFLPHVCWEGEVCYNDGEGICIDLSQKKEIAEYALDKVIAVLSKQDVDDFYNEYEGYWNKQATTCPVYSYIEPDDRIRELRVSVNDKDKKLTAFLPGNEDTAPNDEYKFLHLCKSNRTEMRAFYLPLESCIEPPKHGQPVGIQILDNIINALSASNRAYWNEILSNNSIPKPALYLLLSQPRPDGGKSLFGITVPYAKNWLEGKKQDAYKHVIIPLSIHHHTPNYLIQRSGGNSEISGTKVAIIGCGAIGARIAEYIAMSGVSDIALFDGDVYSTDNVYRHVLDSRYIESYKVTALAKQLSSHFPYISVTTEPEFLYDYSTSLDDYDVIIDATGDPTLSRKFNLSHRASESDHKPLLLTVWLEAFSLGGHVVISNGISEGCLHCLYFDNDKDGLLNQYAFIEPGQSITKNLTGCGGAFTPFSAIDAAKTAEMAVRLLLDKLDNNKNNDEYYWFWIGDDTSTKNSHMSTSDWYVSLRKDKKNENEIRRGCVTCCQNI